MYPALQPQSVRPSLPAGEMEFEGQLLQEAAAACEYLPDRHCAQGAEPGAALLVPGEQAVHASPSGPV